MGILEGPRQNNDNGGCTVAINPATKLNIRYLDPLEYLNI